MDLPASSSLLVVTADPDLLDSVLSITAAAGLEPTVAADAGALPQDWGSAAMVLIGNDQAAAAAALGLPRRTEVYLVGADAEPAEFSSWSIPLGAAVVTLPSSVAWLSAAVAELGGGHRAPTDVVAVVGGSGGVGASTLAAALAYTAAQSSQRTLLVDADPFGGGLDLLLGAEAVPGWRWPRLAGARGQLGDLGGQLPRLDGIEVLSMARSPAGREHGLAAESLRAVLRSAARTHQLTVIDLPRGCTPALEEAVPRAGLVVVVVAGSVRGAAAGAEVLGLLRGNTGRLGLVVRRGRPYTVEPDSLADGLGVPLLGCLVEEPALALAADRGDPPGRVARGPLARLSRTILAQLPASTADRAPAAAWS